MLFAGSGLVTKATRITRHLEGGGGRHTDPMVSYVVYIYICMYACMYNVCMYMYIVYICMYVSMYRLMYVYIDVQSARAQPPNRM